MKFLLLLLLFFIIVIVIIIIIIIFYYIVIFIKSETPDDTRTRTPLAYPTSLHLRTTSLARCQQCRSKRH